MAVVVSPVLVGRRGELEVLAEAAHYAASGQPAIVLVGGEAGVGKSRLVEEAAARASTEGLRVVTGACVELGGEGLPFAPLVDILRSLARSLPPEQLDEVLGPARRELARLLPELDPTAPAASDGGGESSRLFELVLGVVGRLAEQGPAMLVVEDLHWADRSTVDLLAFLSRTLREVPVVLIGTYRSDELHRRHPLRPLLTSLERVRAVERLELARFTRDEVAEQLEAIMGSPADGALVDEVFERSEGNAFLVEETLGIVRAGENGERLPPSLADVLLARVERMDDQVQHVLRVVAAAGSRVPDPLVAAVAGMDEPALLDALRLAVEHHLLVADESGYSFRHTLMRDAVYYEMLPGERTGLHRAYADAVETDPELAGGEGPAAAALAHHSYAAHDLPRALAAAIQAARHATSSYAPADAERHLERALEVWPQVPDAEERAGMDQLGVIELAVDAAIAAGDESRALALVDDVLPSVDRASQATRAALLLARRAEALRWLSRGHGLAELEEAVRLLPSEPATPELAEVLAQLASSMLLTADLAGAAEVARRGVEAARAVGDRRRETSALTSLGSAIGYLGDIDGSIAMLRDAVGLATGAGDDAAAVRAYTNLSDTLELAGRHAEASEAARDGLAYAQRVGLGGRWSVYLGVNGVEPLVSLGRWDEAGELLAKVLQDNPPSERSAGLYAIAGSLAIARGRQDEATRLLELIRKLAGDQLDFQTAAALALLEVEVQLAARDLDSACDTVRRALLEQHADQDARTAWPLVWLGMRVEADRAAIARDRREDGARESEGWTGTLADIAAQLPADTDRDAAFAALVAGERSRVRGEPGLAEWRAAETACRAADAPQRLAYALLRVAEAEVAAGDRTEASKALREASEVASRLGAKPLADEAALLAQRARLPLTDEPREAPAEEEPNPFGLTDRELEVLRLIAAGQTNREIGGTLYMSPKTASAHVSRILSKLGVSGRVEAAAVAHRLGLSYDSNGG